MSRDVKDRILAADQFDKEKEYWFEKLSGEPVKTVFPPDFPPAGSREQNTAVVNFQAPEPLYNRLMQIANKSDSRLHVVLVTGLLLLLYKYTCNTEISIGTPIDKQEEDGDFINTILPLRVRIDEQSSVKQFLMEAKRTVFEASENQNYPIETIPYELGIPVIEGEFPFFDIALILENIQDKRYLRDVNPNIIFSFLRTPDSLECTIEYNADLYEAQGIRRIADYFNIVMQEAFFNVDSMLVDIPILTQDEKECVVFEFNKTDAQYPSDKTIHQLFEEQVEKTPNNIAVESRGKTLTYNELNARANQLARVLREKAGVRQEPVIAPVFAIMLECSLEVPVAVFAALKAGGTYLPLGNGLPPARLDYILEDSRASVLITREAFIRDRNIQCPVLDIEDETLFNGRENNLEPSTHANDIAYIIYTSGTTGNPKGVMIEQRGLVNYISWAVDTYVRDEPVNFPLYTSISFDLTVTSLFTPLVTGNTLIAYGGMDNHIYIEDVIDDDRVGVVKLTPSHMQFLRFKKVKQSNIKRFIVGGEKLETGLALDIFDKFNRGIEIYNEYGPTETVVGSMIYRFNPGEDDRDSVPIGVPIQNTRIYLLDRHLQPVPTGAEGEIYIAGDGLARGYIRNPQLTGEKFLPDPFFPGQKMYKSGDIAVRLSNGNIKYKGRSDHQVKIRGFRVELNEIEERILQYDHIKEVAVVVNVDDEIIYAFFVADEKIDQAALRINLAETLPDYMVPGLIRQLEKMPLTSNGKIDRKALLGVDLIPDEDNYTPPENEDQAAMIDIWSEVLGIEKEKIGIHTNFFELGGHSLKVMSLVGKIHKRFDVQLSMVKIFDSPTTAELVKYIREEAAQNVYAAIESQEIKEYYPLSSPQQRFFLAQQANLENTAYNMPGTLVLDPAFDETRLEPIFLELIQRHESMRTSFQLVGNEPFQVVHPDVPFAIEHYDAREEEPRDIMSRFLRPFDISTAPLFRAALIDTGDKKILAIDLHHIISDGVSMQVLAREFGALANEDLLPQLAVQYKDYASWQYNKIRDGEYNPMETFWLDTLEGMKVTRVPEDQSESGSPVKGKYRTAEIEKETYLKIKEFCAKHNLTFFSFMYAVFSFVLYKETGENDLTVGTPVENRDHPDLENVIGVFLNVFLLRARIDADDTLVNNILKINDHVVAALGNGTYPYEELYYKLKDRCKLQDDELYTILFNYLPDEHGDKILPGQAPADALTPVQFTPKYPITLYLSDTYEKLILNLVYRGDLYCEDRIGRIVHNYLKYVETVVTDEDLTVSGLDYEDVEKSDSLEGLDGEFEVEDLF